MKEPAWKKVTQDVYNRNQMSPMFMGLIYSRNNKSDLGSYLLYFHSKGWIDKHLGLYGGTKVSWCSGFQKQMSHVSFPWEGAKKLEPKELKPGKTGFQGQVFSPANISWVNSKRRESLKWSTYRGVHRRRGSCFCYEIYFMGSYNENVSLSFQVTDDIQR